VRKIPVSHPSESPRRAPEVARLIDHTLLKPEASRAQIERLCEEAVRYHFATVCVNPSYVRLCAELVRPAGDVGVCSVVSFPLGATPPEVKAFEAARALDDGATELDMVQNIGALKSGDLDLLRRDLAAVIGVAHQRGAICKVILEMALLTPDEKERAILLAADAGADFVKTSTGFGPGGATAEDVALIRRLVGPVCGVKAAGGIRALADVEAMIRAGATRIGASAGVAIVREALGESPAGSAGGY